jgi:hypothetical protein
MNIIFSRQVAEELREKYTVLELETFEVEGKLLETFCVVPQEAISLQEMPVLDKQIDLHNQFVLHLKKKDYTFCRSAAEHLIGKFGGELDSFYTTVLERENQEEPK